MIETLLLLLMGFWFGRLSKRRRVAAPSQEVTQHVEAMREQLVAMEKLARENFEKYAAEHQACERLQGALVVREKRIAQLREEIDKLSFPEWIPG